MPGKEKAMQLLKFMKGFDAVVSNKVNVLSAGNGSCVAEVKLDEEHTNVFGSLHGGFAASLVDVISGAGLFTHEKGECGHVSINMTIDYLKGASLGDTILIDSKTLKVGKSLAVMEVEIKDKKTGALLVKGKHTKYLLV